MTFDIERFVNKEHGWERLFIMEAEDAASAVKLAEGRLFAQPVDVGPLRATPRGDAAADGKALGRAMAARRKTHGAGSGRPPKTPAPVVLEAHCIVWNSKYPVGTEVKYYPVIGGREFRVRKTRTAAEVLSGHTAVVWLEGESGCVALDACSPVQLRTEGGK